MFCQHGTGEKHVAAKAALSTITLADEELVLNILLFEMHQYETPDLSNDVNYKSEMADGMDTIDNQMLEKGGCDNIAAKPSVQTLANRFHFGLFSNVALPC
jgi:hypothetical protein